MDGQPPREPAARRVRQYRRPRRISYGALGQLRRAHPVVEVRVREDYATNLLAAITELATDPMVLATSPDHPLASRDQIPLTQLRDEPMVALVGSVALTV